MKKIQEKIVINAAPERVFAYMDDICKTGWHMEERSMPLMGGKLELEILTANQTGVGATYRWKGKIIGMIVDFTEVVTKWIKNQEKVWHTVGDAKIIIMSFYEMSLLLIPVGGNSTSVTLEIRYELPHSLFGKILGLLFAGRYGAWCLRRMCQDAKKAIEGN